MEESGNATILKWCFEKPGRRYRARLTDAMCRCVVRPGDTKHLMLKKGPPVSSSQAVSSSPGLSLRWPHISSGPCRNSSGFQVLSVGLLGNILGTWLCQ